MTEYFRLDAAQTLKEIDSRPEGLSHDEVVERRSKYGKNELPRGKSISLLQLIFNQFKEIMVIILLVAAAISLVMGDLKDVIVILLIVIANAAIGAYQEYRAEQALEALSGMQVPQVRTRRAGEVHMTSADDIVPGDIILLGEGDHVPADGRLLQVANLQVEEAALTGESTGVYKKLDPVTQQGEIALGDRHDMVYMGTAVTYGRGEMIVTGTGLNTEIGKIASLIMNAEETTTPLQKRIEQLSLALVRGAVGVVIVVFIAGLIRGIPLEQMLITSISLAVAAVPEGLPAVITISLSLGASRMIKRNALIRRLPAVETLGSVTTICSDKTGTLTRNQMTVTLFALPGHNAVSVTGIGYMPDGKFIEQNESNGDQHPIDPKTDATVGRFLKAMALATDAYLEDADNNGEFEVVGDTTEGALLVAAHKVGWSRAMLETDLPRVSELPFSSERKAMTTIHEPKTANARELFDIGDSYLAITKGAPDRLLEWASGEHTPEGRKQLTEERRQIWQREIDQLASKGLRVLAVAYRALPEVPREVTPEIERDLNLLGLIGILDPARPEAKAAVQTARAAGIRPIMITGDHALTAEAIARDLGIIEEGSKAITGAQIEAMTDAQLNETVKTSSAFARVSPEHKMRLVKTLQGQGQVVAMTGDGVNDAPALKQADIGVAMGITGTEVSKGAADMVLTDDNFASIVAAVEEGRTIYDNIRKFVLFLLSSNIGEILVMFVGILVGMPIPLLAIQILWVNLVTDGLPAIALGFDPSGPGIMQRPPRPKDESIFADGMGQQILLRAVLLAVLTLGAFLWSHAHHNLNPFSATLNLETFSAAQLADLVEPEAIPEQWDTLTPVERRTILETAVDTGESLENEIVAEAERIPRTVAFTVLALGQIFHVLVIHAGNKRSFFSVWFAENRFLFYAVVATFALQLAVIYVPFFQLTFETLPLALDELVISILIASLILFILEGQNLLLRRREV